MDRWLLSYLTAFGLDQSVDGLEVQGSHSHSCDECNVEQSLWEVCLSMQEERATSAEIKGKLDYSCLQLT